MHDETSETAGGGEVAAHEDVGGEVRVDVHLDRETVWLTQRQMAEVFDSTPENVLMHLRNIFASGELEAKATTKEFLAVRTEGSRRRQAEVACLIAAPPKTRVLSLSYNRKRRLRVVECTSYATPRRTRNDYLELEQEAVARRTKAIDGESLESIGWN